MNIEFSHSGDLFDYNKERDVYCILSREDDNSKWKLNMIDIGIIQPYFAKKEPLMRDDFGNVHRRSNAYLHTEVYLYNEYEAEEAAKHLNELQPNMQHKVFKAKINVNLKIN